MFCSFFKNESIVCCFNKQLSIVLITTVCLSIYSLKDIWVVSKFGQLWINLLWIFTYGLCVSPIYHFFSSLGCSMISYLKFFGKPKVTQILLFSSRIFVILDFTFMSMIYFELIVIRCKLEVDLALFYCKAGNRLLLVFYILICTQKFTKLFFFFSFF